MKTINTNGEILTSSTGSSVLLETNGSSNSTQSVLNLVAGSNITLSESGGAVTICSSGGGGGSPGGSNQSIQVNCSGSFYGDSVLTYDLAVNSLNIGCGVNTGCSTYSIAHGYSDIAYNIQAEGFTGNQAFGFATNCGQIKTMCSTKGGVSRGNSSDSSYIYAYGDGSESTGYANSNSYILADSHGSFASGYAQGGARIEAYGEGSEAMGYVTNCGYIMSSSSYAGKAFGKADGSGTYIQTLCGGGLAHGDVTNCSIIVAYGGSHAHGVATCGGSIQAQASGSHAFGYADNGAYIHATNNGGTAVGYATNCGYIVTCGYGGNWAMGYSDGSAISSVGQASGVFGYAICSGVLTSSGAGSFAHGEGINYGAILSSGYGSDASGYSDSSGSQINASGAGSVARGYAGCGSAIITSGDSSETYGYGSSGTYTFVTCGIASRVQGYSTGGNFYAYGNGSIAQGVTSVGDISTSGNGSLSMGHSTCGGITSNGSSAWAVGYTVNGQTIACGNNVYSFGDNVQGSGNNIYSFGRSFSSSTDDTFNVGYGNIRFLVNPDNAFVKAGLSDGNIARIGGTVNDHLEDAGNTGTSETDLYIYSSQAQSLGYDGDKFEMSVGGTFVSSVTALRRIRLYFAGNQIFDSGTLTISSAASWVVKAMVMRTSSSTARYMVTMNTEFAALSAYTDVGSLSSIDFTTSNEFKITGTATSTGAATDDIVLKLATVQYLPTGDHAA